MTPKPAQQCVPTVIGVLSPNSVSVFYESGPNRGTWTFVLENTSCQKPQLGDEQRYLEMRDRLYNEIISHQPGSLSIECKSRDFATRCEYGIIRVNGKDLRLPMLESGLLDLHPAVDLEPSAKKLREAEKKGKTVSCRPRSDSFLRTFVRTEDKVDSERLFAIFKQLRDRAIKADVLQICSAVKYLVRLHGPSQTFLYLELNLIGITVPTTNLHSATFDFHKSTATVNGRNRIDDFTLKHTFEAAKLTNSLFGHRVNVYLDAVGMKPETWKHVICGRIFDSSEHGVGDVTYRMLQKGLAMIQRGSVYVDPSNGEKVVTQKAFSPYGVEICDNAAEGFLLAERQAITGKLGIWASKEIPSDGEGILGLGSTSARIHIFIDNSNLWIEGKHTKGKILNLKNTSLTAGSSYYTQDRAWRVDYARLLQLIYGRNARGIEHPKPRLFGSRPPEAEDVWVHCEACGIIKDITNRNRNGKEKECDQKLCSKMQDVYYVEAHQDDVFVLIAGDRDYCSCLQTILSRRDTFKPVSIFVVSWSSAASQLKRVPGVTFVNLDPFRDAITYSSERTRLLEIIPLKALEDGRLISVYPDQKQCLLAELKNGFVRNRDYKIRYDLLYNSGQTVHAIFLDKQLCEEALRKIGRKIEMNGFQAKLIASKTTNNRFAYLAYDDEDEDESSDGAYELYNNYYDGGEGHAEQCEYLYNED